MAMHANREKRVGMRKLELWWRGWRHRKWAVRIPDRAKLPSGFPRPNELKTQYDVVSSSPHHKMLWFATGAHPLQKSSPSNFPKEVEASSTGSISHGAVCRSAGGGSVVVTMY